MPMLMSNRDRPAKLHYIAYSFRMLSPGDHVLCAVTGEKIRLDDLSYWSVETQKPYASDEFSVQATITDKVGSSTASGPSPLSNISSCSPRTQNAPPGDRKLVVLGRRVSVYVDL